MRGVGERRVLSALLVVFALEEKNVRDSEASSDSLNRPM